MSENSKIECTDHTFNPWIGCTKVDELCAHCYAEQATPTRVARKKGVELWGKGKARQRTSENNWKEPLRWNKAPISGRCNACGMGIFAESWNTIQKKDVPWVCNCGGDISWVNPKVFCASLADWLDEEVPIEWLADLLKLIHDTPNLTWQLLTKRPENWEHRIRESQAYFDDHSSELSFVYRWLKGGPPANVWIGTSVGTQKSADTRIPQLLAIPAKVRFLSCEPLLEAVNLFQAFCDETPRGFQMISKFYKGEQFDPTGSQPPIQFKLKSPTQIHWVIGGFESGPHARPGHPNWMRLLRDQCQAAKVPFFFKQWGEWRPLQPEDSGDLSKSCFWDESIVGTKPGWQSGISSGGQVHVFRAGKKAAGRLLDGREWNEFPEV